MFSHPIYRTILLCLLAVLLATYIIYFSVGLNYVAIFFPFLLLGGVYLWRHPKILGYIFILATVDFVGFIDPEKFIRLPGLFKFRDLLYIMMMSILLIDGLRKGWHRWPSNKLSRGCYMLIWGFLALTFVQLILTTLRFNLPLISSLKIAREFFYIAVFFYFARFFSQYNDINELLKFISYICVTQFISMLLQIFGIDIGSISRVDQLLVGDNYVTRVYIPAYFYALAAACYCCIVLLTSQPKNKLYIAIILIASLSSVILSYTRTYWVSLLICLILLMLLLQKKYVIKLMRIFFVSLVLVFPIVLFQSASILTERFSTIINEVGDDEGNFIYRFSENPQRLEAFMDYPFIGPGFIHPDFAPKILGFVIDETGKSEAQIQRALMLQTNDSGLITLLVSFGLLGAIWAIAQILVVIKIAQTIKYYGQVIYFPYIGIAAFVVATWLTCVTTYGFTYYDGTVAMAVALYLLSTVAKTILQKDFNEKVGGL